MKKLFLPFILILCLSFSFIAGASTVKSYNFGYRANIPQEIIGFNFFMLSPNRFGFYFDAKMNITSFIIAGDNYYKNISVEQAESWDDELLQESKGYISANVGATKMFSTKLAMYIGLGLTLSSNYRKYYDSFEILGHDGEYWISEGDTEYGINGLGGFIFITSSGFFIQLGAEVNPAGGTLGFGKGF